MTASRNSAFYWRGQSSIFATDPAFTPRTNGKTASQIGAEVVERRTREEGRNPGTLTGISRRADVAIPRFSLATLAPKESTPDAMARRGKLMRSAI
mgnify:FL=1